MFQMLQFMLIVKQTAVQFMSSRYMTLPLVMAF